MFSRFPALLVTPALISAQLPLLQIPFFQNAQPDIQQQVSIESKPAVVRIVTACQASYDYDIDNNGKTDDPADLQGISIVTGEVGTGFFVDSDGYIVTSSRIVQPAIEESCKDRLFRNLVERITGERDPENVSDERRKEIRTRSKFSDTTTDFVRGVVLPNGEIVDFEPPDKSDVSADLSEEGGDGTSVIKVNISNAPTLRLADSSTEVQLEDVTIIGYPIAADTTQFLIKFFDAYLSQGITRKLDSSLGDATPTNGQITNNRKTLPGNIQGMQLEPQLSEGNVGSPVLNNKGEVIGVIFYSDQSTFVPFVFPINPIIRAVRRSGANFNQANVTNLRYEEGLKSFWAGNYEGAKTQFEAVQSLFPQHVEANRMLKESQLKSGTKWIQRDYFLPLGIVGTFLLALLGAYFVVKQRRLAEGNRNYQPLPPDLPGSHPPQNTWMSSGNGVYGGKTEMSFASPLIELRNKKGQVQKFYLSGDCHRLGRDPEWADLKVTEDDWEVLSKHHAVFQKDSDSYRIFDGDQIHQSTNGTYVNNVRITTREGYLLKDKDELRIGLDPDNQVVMVYSTPAKIRPLVS